MDISDLRYICYANILSTFVAANSLSKADLDAPDLQDQQSGVALQKHNVRRLLQSEIQKILSCKVFILQECYVNAMRTTPSLMLSLQKDRARLAFKLAFESDFEKCLCFKACDTAEG